MIKITGPDSFDFGEPVAQLVDIHSRGIDKAWMTKRAAVLVKEIDDLRPEKGHSFIHLISLSAGEVTGSNKNGDFFNEGKVAYNVPYPKDKEHEVLELVGGLKEYHPTFLQGHVFSNHRNDSPKKSIGEIKVAAYNEDMHRGELIIKVPHNHNWEDELQKLANDEQVGFSMAFREPFDQCSLCGNRARARSEYCDHLKNHMTEIDKNGNQAFALNDRGRFFDISKVFRPADRIAWSFRKVASVALGGAEMAEAFGLLEKSAKEDIIVIGKTATYKRALVEKLSELEKIIESAPGQAKALSAGCPSDEMDDDDMKTLNSGDTSSVLGALGNVKIILSLEEFMKLVTKGKSKDMEGDVSSAKSNLPGIFSKLLSGMDLDEVTGNDSYDGEDRYLPPEIREVIKKLHGSHSLDFGPVEGRAKITVIRGTFGPKATKTASHSLKSEAIAKEYAAYLLSFVKRAAKFTEDSLVERLTTAKNYFIF